MHCLIPECHVSTVCIFWCAFGAQFKIFITLESINIFLDLGKAKLISFSFIFFYFNDIYDILKLNGYRFKKRLSSKLFSK